MNAWVYREVSQRGGMRWFLGEPEKEYYARKEQKELEKAALDSGEEVAGEHVVQAPEQAPQPAPSITFVAPPTPLPETEQTPNRHPAPMAEREEVQVQNQPVQVGASQNQSIQLQEGSKIEF
jgi:hypothetical protein